MSLKQVKQRYEKQLLALPNVVGVFEGRKTRKGIRSDEPALVVFVKKKKPIEYSTLKRIFFRGLHPANAVPSMIEGVQTDVVQSGEIVIFKENCSKQRPLKPAAGISHPDVTCGTFGGVAVDENGARVVITNNHVAANSNAAQIGDLNLQPCSYCGGGPADAWGKLGGFIPIELVQNPCSLLGGFVQLTNLILGLLGRHSEITVKQASGENLVDVAWVIPDEGVELDSRIPEIGQPSPGVVEAYVGMLVEKTGWRTWHTEGEVIGINAAITVSYGAAGMATFTDQIIIGPVAGGPAVSAGGDSGSMFWTRVDGKIKPVALLFAGSEQENITVAGRAANVEGMTGKTFV